MSHFVYILYSSKLKKFYKGQTNDLKDRLKRHNAGYERSTKLGAPWILIWSTSKSSRSEALTLEKKVKNLSVKGLLNFMLKYEDDLEENGKVIIQGLRFES